MSIRKGADWGVAATVPADVITVASDRALALHVGAALRHGTNAAPCVLTGGDLHRSLGSPAPTGVGSSATAVTVDIGAVQVDDELHYFAAHMTAHRRGWAGRFVVVANAAHHREWNIAPKAHPGDGWLDTINGSLSWGDRRKARRRLPTGTHLPHPDLATRRIKAFQYDLDRATPVYCDGSRVGRTQHFSVSVMSDAVTIYV
jgi:hypothetical protein